MSQFMDKEAEMLCDFGLTINQAKVYLAIVRLGLASVGSIAKVSHVRREDVYRTLPKLEKLGLTERVLGTPVRVRALPLEDALSLLISREKQIAQEKVSALGGRKDALLKHLKASIEKSRAREEEAQFALLMESEAITARLVMMIKSAEKELDFIVATEEFFHFLPTFVEPLEKAIEKKVKVRLIMEVRELEDTLLRNVRAHIPSRLSIEVKYAYQPLSHYSIVDHNQVMMATSSEQPLGEHPYLWTNNRSLVELMQENFEELWHVSVAAKTLETTAIPDKVTQFVRQLRPKDHVIMVYESTEVKHHVLFNYIKEGLEKGEVAIYVASDEDPSSIKEAMKQFGIDVERNEKKGALRILSYTDFYIVDGKFSCEDTIDRWNRFYREAKSKGFKGLRVTGETACFFNNNLVDELAEYERALHRTLDIPMVAICAYNSNMLSKAHNPINLYNELVKAHGTVLFAGIDNKVGRIEIRT